MINVGITESNGYNFYVLDFNGYRWAIGGVPYGDVEYAKRIDGVILLTSKPEYTMGLSGLLDKKPEIPIYASSAGLRNVKEIVNRDINEKLVKDGMKLHGIEFMITPNIGWVDSIMVKAGSDLYSGEMFSSSPTYEVFYNDNLAINREFVKTAFERIIDDGEIETIRPAMGNAVELSNIADTYKKLTKGTQNTRNAVVVYSSRYGFTKSMAECIANNLKTYKVQLINAENCDNEKTVNAINNCDFLAVGTNTINRNAPKCIWDIITRLDLTGRRGMPYFVFGSFGWAGDGIKLINKTLAAMGMKMISKPMEVLFKPADKDFSELKKAAEKIDEYKDCNE